MFGRSRPIIFDPYGRRRRSGLPPRWLVLLLIGIALGAAAVLIVQERYLPPRLSADAGAQLRSAFERASTERAAAQAELARTGQQLASALAERQRLTEQLGTSQAAGAGLQADLAAVVAALPADPRAGVVQVRAARFATTPDGALSYTVVLTRERAGGQPLAGQLQLIVAGETARDPSVTLPPAPVTIGRHAVVRGSAPLPSGFRPRQSTIQILDRSGVKPLGMRVMRIERGAPD